MGVKTFPSGYFPNDFFRTLLPISFPSDILPTVDYIGLVSEEPLALQSYPNFSVQVVVFTPVGIPSRITSATSEHPTCALEGARKLRAFSAPAPSKK